MSDILEGPKYLMPMIEFIEDVSFRCLENCNLKLLHRLFLLDNNFKFQTGIIPKINFLTCENENSVYEFLII